MNNWHVLFVFIFWVSAAFLLFTVLKAILSGDRWAVSLEDKNKKPNNLSMMWGDSMWIRNINHRGISEDD